MHANAIAILKDLASVPWIDVAFLIDSRGRLLASVGSSPSFSATGEFSTSTPEPTGEPEDSLYITGITRSVYLGVLFPASVPIEDVRAEIRPAEAPLAAAIAEP